MPRLDIFGTDAAKASKEARNRDFSDDLVGRFRSGFVLNSKPQSLDAFRVTTGDPIVADKIHEILGGDEPQEWEAPGEDNIEVFTSASSVEIVLDKHAIKQQMVLRNANGEIVRISDGAVLTYPEDYAGKPDPQAGQSLRERKENARIGMGSKPETDVFFKIKGHEDLGKFKFHTGSWDFVSDLNYYSTIEELEEIWETGGRALATLALVDVSFTAKGGPRKGNKVSYKKPVLKVTGSVPAEEA